jgi:hypothetical protein
MLEMDKQDQIKFTYVLIVLLIKCEIIQLLYLI